MSGSLYKYVGPTNIHHVFSSNEHVTVKCSLPKDFNDPYELFLTIDFNENPDALAFYADAIGRLPQFPTTCFSLSPAVTPMWAHYAQNQEGFAIELDEKKLAAAFPESQFGNIEYSDVANPAITDMLHRASALGKPRHLYMLHNAVFRAAYFSKTNCWSYEQERRMVVQDSETRKLGDILLIDIPADCIKSIIVGPRASSDTVAALTKKSEQLECYYFQFKIGKTSAKPYFLSLAGDPYEFREGGIASSLQSCADCKEPLPHVSKKCSWCAIDESHTKSAVMRNPFRLYDHYGLLENYIEQMDRITRDFRKK
jgi:hypothetical protein